MNKLICVTLCWYLLFSFPYPVKKQNGINRKYSFTSTLQHKTSSKLSFDRASNIITTGNPLSSINQEDLAMKTENPDCDGNSFQKLFYSNERYMICSTLYQMRDGSIIMAGIGGTYSDWQQNKRSGAIFKLDKDGNIIWQKEISSSKTQVMSVSYVNELADGSLIISGEHNKWLADETSNGIEAFIAKLDASGNIIWSKSFSSKLETCEFPPRFEVNSIAEGKNGNLYIGASARSCTSTFIQLVFKVNNNGNPIWNTALDHKSGIIETYGVYELNENEVVVLGKTSNWYYRWETPASFNFLTFSTQSGELLSDKSWAKEGLPDDHFPLDFLPGYGNSVRLENGHYLIYGLTYWGFHSSQSPAVPFNIFEFDENFDFISGSSISSPETKTYYNIHTISANKTGKLAFGIHRSNAEYELEIHFGTFQDGKLGLQRYQKYAQKDGLGESRLFPLADGSFVKANRYNDKADRVDYIDYLKISDEDVTNEDCTGKIGNYFTATPMKLVPFDELELIPLLTGQVHETKNEIQASDINFLSRNGCITTGACQKLSIKSESVCSFNKPVRFWVPYDAGCISNLKWALSDSLALESVKHINDSAIEIKFNKEWQGKVYAYYEKECGIEKDSVLVNLGSAGLIDLGADRSICEGDSVVLDAGDGFTNYLWNINSTNPKITVSAKGLYAVEAVDPGGCISRDTLYITNVNPRPQSIVPESVQLCAGSRTVLNAGDGFSEYLWQNGSTSQTFEVTEPGKYFFKIRDANGCTTSDSVEVIDFASSTQSFLGADTSICVGSSITLQPKQNFAEYIWNTGMRTNSITIGQPGLYVLYASMDGLCWAKDSIVVSFASCTNDIRFPNAFSPNGDGKNDTYKVAAPAELLNYQLIIYNRWGQVLFKTSDPTAGWDGTISGKRQPSGTYIWQCRYQLKGNETKVKKGSLLLIRR